MRKQMQMKNGAKHLKNLNASFESIQPQTASFALGTGRTTPHCIGNNADAVNQSLPERSVRVCHHFPKKKKKTKKKQSRRKYTVDWVRDSVMGQEEWAVRKRSGKEGGEGRAGRGNGERNDDLLSPPVLSASCWSLFSIPADPSSALVFVLLTTRDRWGERRA